MDASLALRRGDYEAFHRMEEARSARAHLEYAIQEGGTLYVVEDARRMLAERT